MRILLISTNRHDRFVGSLPIRPIPLGLAILLGVLRDTHHEVHVLDLMFERAPRQAIRRAIRKSSPDLIGVSVRNLDAVGGRRVPRSGGVRSFLPEIQSWVLTCRRGSQAPVVLGGPAVSLLPREAFAALEPDFLLAGDASRTFLALAERLEGAKPWKDLPGLTYRHGTTIQMNPMGPWQSPAVTPHYDAFDLRKYTAAGYSVSVLNKLWPYIRTAGPTPMMAMPGPVVRPIADLLADLRDLRTRLRIRRVFLADSGFNVPLPEAKALCRALQEAGLGLEWATGLQPGSMDDELARLMRDAGCRMTLLAGPGPLQEPLRDFDWHLAQFATTAEPMCAIGVSLLATAVFGRPGESRDTVERTLELLSHLNPFHVQLSAGIRILPFTPLAEYAKGEGVIRQDGDCLYPVRYLSPDLKDWLPRRLRAAARTHPSWHVV
jgi:radical SAM superfamily enzyme YgiQ (UPF0313 family)